MSDTSIVISYDDLQHIESISRQLSQVAAVIEANPEVQYGIGVETLQDNARWAEEFFNKAKDAG